MNTTERMAALLTTVLLVGCKGEAPPPAPAAPSTAAPTAIASTVPASTDVPKAKELVPSKDCTVKSKNPLRWACALPKNEMPLATFIATSEETPMKYVLVLELSSYFNYEFRNAKKTHYAITLTEPGNARAKATGYIKRDGAGAAELFELVKDGDPHIGTVVIAHPKNGQSNEIVEIQRFVMPAWELADP
jgi:hypothetical protein